MTRGIQGKLFLASIVVILAVGIPATLSLRAELTDTVERRIESEALANARVVRIGMEYAPVVGDSTARWFADAIGARVDVIGEDGVLRASSSDDAIAGDLLDRPEIRGAAATGEGIDWRGGTLHVAVPYRADGARGYVRLSAPGDDLDDAYARLYTILAIAAVIGVAVAIGMTLLASQIVTAEVRRLAEGARELAGGGRRRLEVETSDAIGVLGGSINRMADGVDRTAAALAQERALFAAVLDSVTQGVVVLDRDRRVTMMNDVARELLELDAAPIGEAFLDHVRFPALINLLPAGKRDTAELQTTRGARLGARVEPLRTGGCLLMLEDVTAVRRLETIRRDFVANVSHELRTPVSIIRANAETLLGGAKDDPAFSTRLIEGLHRNAERLALILADLLDLSRLEAGQYRLDLTPVDLRALADGVVASLATKAGDKQIELVVEVAPDLRARGDAKALDQVLTNLVDNALKYSPAGGHVWITARADRDRVRVEVRDDGPGIAPHHRERIFERFYRIDAGRSREMGGTGLGLSIVKHLVESMNGKVGVDGNRPRGTRFWFELDSVGAPTT